MKKIVFIDSGIGGLHVLNECEKLVNGCHLIYLADTYNAPYGAKSKTKLQTISKNLIQYLQTKYKPDIVVLACNTLTTTSISYLRKKFPQIIFIGIEPALKTAKIYGGKTIVFATKRTIKQYNKLNKKVNNELKFEFMNENLNYNLTEHIYKVSSENLAKLIDDNCNNLDILMPKLKNIFKNKKYYYCQNIVLGCTHYVAIKEQLNELFYGIRFFDGINAVAKRVANTINIQPCNDRKNKLTFLTTDGNSLKLKNIKNYYQKIKNY